MTRFDLQGGDCDPDVFRVAAHEAGHAIATVLSGLQVLEIKIWWTSRTDFGGFVRTADYDTTDRDLLNGSLTTSMAGHEAEGLWLTRYQNFSSHRAALRTYRASCEHDLRLFREERRLGKALLTETAARARAHSQLIAHWHRVERLVDRLVRTRHLTTV
ncbi:hypothetical protein LZ318_31870 [Saccharopolyspora indica]|uniref:hypothetical protein n=1 Tax=Saccharopolyspora indica TaxID=1229659 RepID=UPI0022EB8AAA|nr:hypothetical protein [Saccharopolyspora indica]MDA3644164.1 hypothetical protein [Saccharopolyspora indica]